MLLRLYSANHPLLLLTIPVIAGAGLLPSLAGAELPLLGVAYPFDFWSRPLVASPVGGPLFLVALIFGGAWLIGLMFNRREFHPSPTYLPSLVYAVACTCLLLYGASVAAMVANLFLIAGLNRVLSVYRQGRALGEYFEAGLWLGLAALVYPPYLSMAAALWVAIIVTRAFAWREHLVPLLAFGVPFLYWVCWHFWNRSTDEMVLFHRVVSLDGLPSWSDMRFWERLFGLLTAASLLMAIPRFGFLGSRLSNKGRNIRTVFLLCTAFLLLSCGMAWILAGQFDPSAIAVPVAVIVGHWYTNYRVSLLAPFVFYTWLAVAAMMGLSFYVPH